MCQTNRFPSVPKNLICCQSPVIKWSSCLTHRHSSNTPSCLRAFPNWDCWQDSGWPHGNHEPPLDIPCARLPRGALLSTEKHSPEQKQDQTHARVGGAEPSTLGEGVLESCRAGSRVCGGAGGAGLSETWPRPLAQGSPEFLPQVCKK